MLIFICNSSNHNGYWQVDKPFIDMLKYSCSTQRGQQHDIFSTICNFYYYNDLDHNGHIHEPVGI